MRTAQLIARQPQSAHSIACVPDKLCLYSPDHYTLYIYTHTHAHTHTYTYNIPTNRSQIYKLRERTKLKTDMKKAPSVIIIILYRL